MSDKSTSISADKYPTKPITLLVQFSAGGGTDFLARGMEKKALQYLGQPLVVVNKPGGAGTIAWNELAGAKKDGYTIGMTGIGTILQPMYGQTKYNYSTALEPIAEITNLPILIAVLDNGRWGSLDELIAYAKEHPGAIKYGHSGLGSAAHVLAEMFAQAAGIKMEQVPFQGSSEGIAALLGGHVDIIFPGASELKEHVKSGKIKVLAVGDSHRIPDAEFSNVPTFIEQGINITFRNWQCVAVPKEMPQDIKNKLAASIKEIINDADFQENMRNMGMYVEYKGPEDCAKEWASDSERLFKVVHETGIAERIAAQKK